MIVNCDVKGLEVVVAAQLSGDKTLQGELLNGVDIHESNRDAFSLGVGKDGRLIAKVFKFRLLYGGSAYSYAHDADFRGVSTSQEFWQEVIDKYYNKYSGIKKWHEQLLIEAQTTGKLTIPSGRYYPILPDITKRESWPLTIIKNYPVQGFGADLVMLARLRASQLLKLSGGSYQLCGTIHDSIVVDTPEENVYNIGKLLKQAIEEVPSYCKKLWDYDFSLPLKCEVSYGPNKTDMQELVL
jgi:DNA polymerase I